MTHSAQTGSRLTTALLVVQVLSFLIPVALVSVPPLLDYPNHLARYWLLAGGADHPPLSQIYGVDFNLLTNIGLDLVARWLGPWVGAGFLGSTFIALAIVLPCIGMAALNYAIFRRIDWWLLIPGLLVWNQILLAGFLNFNVGLGLAMLFAAADRALAPRMPFVAFVLRLGAGLALGILHIFALAFFTALLTGLALGETMDWRKKALPAVGRIVLAIAPALMAFCILLLFSPQLPGAHIGTDSARILADIRRGFEGEFSREKMKGSIIALMTYYPASDLLAAGAVAALVIFLAIRGRVRVHAGLLIIGLCLVILFALTPMDLAGTGWFDRRFSLMFPMAVLVALHPEVRPRWLTILAIAALALTTVRTAEVTMVWRNYDKDVAAVHEALAAVTPGSRVMPVFNESPRGFHPPGRYLGTGNPAFWHLPVLAIMWRQAFVPTLFTARGKQPVFVRPPYDQIAVPEGPLESVHVLIDPARENPEWTHYIDNWREKFDFVLVLNADMPDVHGPFAPPPDLQKVADSGFAQLYRVGR